MCGDGKQAYRDISDKFFLIKASELHDFVSWVKPSFELQALVHASNITLRDLTSDRCIEILDYLEEWTNTGENLTLFKWELREVLRTLRQGKVE